jgi:hypothetical protein
VGLRSGLDAVAKRKYPRSCPESNPGHTAHSLVTILSELTSVLSSNFTTHCVTLHSHEIIVTTH